MKNSNRYPVAPDGTDALTEIFDRQIIDRNGEFVCNVDDIEIVEQDGVFTVTAILTGPGAFGPRLNGRLADWVVGIWRRLNPAEQPEPGRIEWSSVCKLDSAVHVEATRAELGVEGFERWLADHVISRIPGCGHE